MRTPTTSHRNTLDATLLSPQMADVVRFKATFTVADSADRMLAPLYAEALERGTQKKTRKQFAEALEALGAELAVGNTHTSITIDGCAQARTLPAFLSLLSEMLQIPAFTKKEIAQVHAQYQQSLADEADNARGRAYDTFTQTLYPKAHPYYRPTIATRRTHLASVTRTTYLEFHARMRIVRPTVSVCAAPNAQEKILSIFATFANGTGTRTERTPAVPIHAAQTVTTLVLGKANVEVYLGNTLPLTLADADYLPFQFGLAVLGKWGGFSGRLMSTVREKEGLTYTIYARTEGVTTARAGFWYIFTFFTPKDLARGIASTAREIQDIVTKGITATELARFTELLKNQFILAHESDGKALALYHDALVGGMSAEALIAHYDVLPHLRRKDINRALATYLDPTRLVIAQAGSVPTKT